MPESNRRTLADYKASGYSHVAVQPPNTTMVCLGGMTDLGPDEKIRNPGDLVRQFAGAVANILEVLKLIGAQPEHIMRVVIYTTDMAAYRAAMKDLTARYRELVGKPYPPAALLQVGLLDPNALVELVVDAAIPIQSGRDGSDERGPCG